MAASSSSDSASATAAAAVDHRVFSTSDASLQRAFGHARSRRSRVKPPQPRSAPSEADRRLQLIAAMIDTLSVDAKVELRHVLASTLRPAPSAAEARVDELGFLATLVAERGVSYGAVRTIPRKLYDELAPKDAPSSRSLVKRFENWTDACQAADGLVITDGRFEGPSVPWPARAPKAVVEPFTTDEAIAAVRLCAKENFRDRNRPPSTRIYADFARRKRIAAKKTGQTVRLPHLSRVYELLAPDPLPGKTRWQGVIDASLE